MSLLISKAGQRCPRRCPVFSRTAMGLEKKTQMSKIHLFAFNLILKFPALTMES